MMIVMRFVDLNGLMCTQAYCKIVDLNGLMCTQAYCKIAV